ncbi:MAG: hypothetical protein HOM25_20765 [Rhodospirillaceae bacterium]|nr:hypothetical protein [Rhodospirillaceae bacterium]
MASWLFSDFEPPLLDWAIERATMHPKGASFVDLDKFWAQSWPATVICCALSVNPPEAHQRRTAEKLGADWHEMEAGHYPMLNHPEEMARLLMLAAEKRVCWWGAPNAISNGRRYRWNFYRFGRP